MLSQIDVLSENIFKLMENPRNLSVPVFQLTTLYITIKLSFDHCWNTRVSYGTPVFQKNNLSHLEMFSVVRYGNTSCDSACRTLEIPLSNRRREQCGSLFRQIVRDKSHVLQYLLPTKTDSHITDTDRLRSAKTYPSFHAIPFSKLIYSLSIN